MSLCVNHVDNVQQIVGSNCLLCLAPAEEQMLKHLGAEIPHVSAKRLAAGGMGDDPQAAAREPMT